MIGAKILAVLVLGFVWSVFLIVSMYDRRKFAEQYQRESCERWVKFWEDFR